MPLLRRQCKAELAAGKFAGKKEKETKKLCSIKTVKICNCQSSISKDGLDRISNKGLGAPFFEILMELLTICNSHTEDDGNYVLLPRLNASFSEVFETYVIP